MQNTVFYIQTPTVLKFMLNSPAFGFLFEKQEIQNILPESLNSTVVDDSRDENLGKTKILLGHS